MTVKSNTLCTVYFATFVCTLYDRQNADSPICTYLGISQCSISFDDIAENHSNYAFSAYYVLKALSSQVVCVCVWETLRLYVSPFFSY